MNIFTLEAWDDEGRKCTFYTVRWEDASENETDKFFNKYNAIPELKTATQQMLSFVLDSIGDDHGAIDALFNRPENMVTGLPNTGKVTVKQVLFAYPNFPLRLYALRVNNRSDMVILFNGGLKSAQTNQESKDIHLKWVEACQFAKRIEDALKDGEIVIDGSNRRIVSANGDDEIYL
ncbi:hypothetical protein BDD43_4875 [Mucilaginibacter gracilis]|uniref:Uncharacterized protein n=1 Tax=Mucilaginibacter gracilis TaxID=423350 RepID=A0A495J997_9SPHI|nr:hypothetical protein [Mucilaginibacter gracilis]RKR84629.1 hypothetical protein BDD43_4875 [Mucilaginibacter gracilis]